MDSLPIRPLLAGSAVYLERPTLIPMTHDPVGDAALGPLRDLLQRYLQVVDVLNSAIDALSEQIEPLSEASGSPPQRTHASDSNVISIDQRHEFQSILAFQDRLSEVLGVATVTLERNGDGGFRFLVEMEEPSS
ncbi:MAG: hypothetical protein ABI577_00295 [bacterium]